MVLTVWNLAQPWCRAFAPVRSDQLRCCGNPSWT